MINYYEKSIGNMCNFVSKKADVARDVDRAHAAEHQFYLITLDHFKDGSSPRIWLKVGIQLAHAYQRVNRILPLARLLPRLHQAVKGKDGRDDPIKAVQVLEILSIEIQMLSLRRHHKRLKVRASGSVSLADPANSNCTVAPWSSKLQCRTPRSLASSKNAVPRCICARVSWPIFQTSELT
jgi:hypothetical protein